MENVFFFGGRSLPAFFTDLAKNMNSVFYSHNNEIKRQETLTDFFAYDYEKCDNWFMDLEYAKV